jgi:hypothetical protein
MMVIPVDVSRAEGATQEGAFVTFVSQAQPPQHILFTSLHQFQQAQDAAPHGLGTIYQELAHEKGIVLGRMDVSAGLLSKASATLLVERLASLYLREERFVLPQTFNSKPEAFKFGAVLEVFGLTSHSTSI